MGRAPTHRARGVGASKLNLSNLPSQRQRRGLGARIEIATLNHVVDHALEAHAAPVLGTVDAADAVGLQLADLVRGDDAAAAAENLDVACAPLPEQVHHVLEVLEVTALVAGDGNALGILLDGGVHDVLYGAVVAQVDHLAASGLEDPPHDVDAGVMPIEEAGGRDEADLVPGRVALGRIVSGVRRSECRHETPRSGETPVYRRPPCSRR